jgi:tRNA threonylcarbamoyladenosine biosynthesis protein TsaE
MNTITITLNDENKTEQLGRILAEVVPDGSTLALCGTLGAGKTRLAQAFAVACGVARADVVSPTFVLCQQYRARRTIYHLDAYRINDDDEFLELGVDEYFDSPAITIVEWADRVIDCLPMDRVEVELKVTGSECRQAVLTLIGETATDILSLVQSRWQSIS